MSGRPDCCRRTRRACAPGRLTLRLDGMALAPRARPSRFTGPPRRPLRRLAARGLRRRGRAGTSLGAASEATGRFVGEVARSRSVPGAAFEIATAPHPHRLRHRRGLEPHTRPRHGARGGPGAVRRAALVVPSRAVPVGRCPCGDRGVDEIVQYSLWRVSSRRRGARRRAGAVRGARRRPVGAADGPAAPRRGRRLRRVRRVDHRLPLSSRPFARPPVRAPSRTATQLADAVVEHGFEGPVRSRRRPSLVVTKAARDHLRGTAARPAPRRIGALTLGGFLIEVEERFADARRWCSTTRSPRPDGSVDLRRPPAERPWPRPSSARGSARAAGSASSWGTGPRPWPPSSAPPSPAPWSCRCRPSRPCRDLGVPARPRRPVCLLARTSRWGRALRDDIVGGRARRRAPVRPRRRRGDGGRSWDELLPGTTSPTSSAVLDAGPPRSRRRRPGLVIFSSGTTSRRRAWSTPAGADPAVLGPGPDLRRATATRDVGAAPDVLDGRAQLGDGRHPGCRRLLGHAGGLRPRRGPGAHGPGAGDRAVLAPPPDRGPRGAPRLGGHRPVLAAQRVTASPSSPATHRPGRHRLEHPGRLRPVGDLRLLHRHQSTTPRDQLRASMAGSSPATSSGRRPRHRRGLGPGQDGELAIRARPCMRALPGAPPPSASTTTASSAPATSAATTTTATCTSPAGDRDDQDRRRQRVAGRDRGPAPGLPAGEAGPHHRRARRPPRPGRRRLHRAQGRRRRHRRRHPVVPRERVAAYKVPKHVLFFADGEIPMTTSATKVRDEELLALVAARLAADPVTTRAETDDHHRRPTHRRRALDASDLDRHMGVPMEPGELKEAVAINDIRRWVQAMHYPNPLHYDERWAAESRFGELVAPQSFAVACDTSHGCSPAQVGPIPNSPPDLRRRRLVVLRPPHRARRPPRLPPDALRLPGHRHEVRRADLLPARRHALHQPAGRAGRPAAVDLHPLPGERGQGEAAVRRAREPEWTDDELADLEERKLAFIDQIQELGHATRLFFGVGWATGWPST